MASIWNPTLETHVAKIDEQHQELFRQADILVDPDKHGRITDMLKFLGEYVILHFRDEQNLQEKSKYPKYETHKKFHTEFLATFREMNRQYSATGDKEIVTAISNLVINWLRDHIMVHDKEFAEYYRKNT
ncbi:MAG: hemerythrin family protein [Spirochaetaceae bacterium]|jgi:hemerythrin|nr:hemerythrin family protein [Spirochaetaceae bacterium]